LRPLDPAPPGAPHCYLSASTGRRWADRAGKPAQARVPDQLAGVPTSGQVGADGLWASLNGGVTRVVLRLTDSVSAWSSRRWWWRVGSRRQPGRRCLSTVRRLIAKQLIPPP
jgi:hypothetical protein